MRWLIEDRLWSRRTIPLCPVAMVARARFPVAAMRDVMSVGAESVAVSWVIVLARREMSFLLSRSCRSSYHVVGGLQNPFSSIAARFSLKVLMISASLILLAGEPSAWGGKGSSMKMWFVGIGRSLVS